MPRNTQRALHMKPTPCQVPGKVATTSDHVNARVYHEILFTIPQPLFRLSRRITCPPSIPGYIQKEHDRTAQSDPLQCDF